MKKKFLSLMMAAAVVATTSVSAFAAEENNVHVTTPSSANIVSEDDGEPVQNVEITGHVQNNDGQMPTASFKVTVPTAANFTVNKDGNFVGPALKIKNEGPQGIDVYAHDFSKTSTGTLKVVPENTITNARANTPRSTVSLKLSVNGVAKAFLGASEEKLGVYQEAELTNKQSMKLLTLAAAGADEAKEQAIQLDGMAGTQQIEGAVKDTFKLVLKIKKAGK